MATNFFDQFDAPKEKPEEKQAVNFFDQFDAPAEEAPKELDSAWDFSGERTLGGRFAEGNKAVPRGVINTLLDSADFVQEFSQYLPGYKLAELAGEKVLDATGRREEADRNKERALALIPKARKYINEESGLKADEKYADLWTTKFGEGAGSFVTFLASGGLGRAALTTFAATTGGGTQVQKLRQAEEAGEDISESERLTALTLGAGIGLLETYTPLRLLKAIPKNIPAPDKAKVIGMVNNFLKTGAGEVVKTGVGEGSQEVASSILQSLVEMGYNPNAELPTGESLWDDFTIGAVLGGGSQAIRDVVVQNRTNAMSGLEMERERKAREHEDGQNALLRMKLDEMASQRVMEKIDPLSFAESSQRAQSEAFKLPPPSEEEVKQFNAPSAFGAVATPSALGELYALRLIGSLGQNFPSDTSFSVKELPGVEKPITNPDGTQGIEKKPLYAVVDGNGNQYGHTTESPQIASSLESNLNKEVQSKGIRSSILDTLMVSPEGYTPEQTDKLFRYGFRTLSPDSNRVTFAALNDAAGTTTENGYIEDLPLDAVASAKEVRNGRFEVQMPDGTKKYIAGLTASQKLNLKRVNEGLPPVTTFGIFEAREALGGDVGRLALPGVSGIQDSLSYGAKVLNGKPIVISEANEVITQRKTTGAEKARAGVDEDGKSVLPDYIEFKTLDEAKRYAGRLNQRTGTSRVMPSEILEGKKGLVAEIKRLLEAKNIVADIGSPEINQLVQAFTGANTFKEMTADDRKLFYNRVRNLPKFEKLTKIPVFKQRLYTPEQFVRASMWQYSNPVILGQEEVGFAIKMDKTDPDYDAVTQSIVDELNRQNDVIGAENRRFTEEVLPIQEEMQEIMRSFGMSPSMLNLGITLKDRQGNNINAEAEGYYDPAFKEVMLAIDAIDPKGELTQEQRVSALKSVLSHEVLHALRNLDMFTQKEYALLETAVARTQKPGKDMTYLQWARRPRSQGGYFEDSPTVQVEEAIADMVRDFIVDKRVIGGKPRNLIERIIKFFQKMRNMMDGYGFKTFDEVIATIESGEVGRRYQSAVTEAEDGTRKFIGPVRSLRASEQLLEKAGRLPARYQKFGDIFAQGPTIVPDQVAQERVPGRVIQEPVAGQSAPVSTDFDPAALEGAEVRMSRKAIESSKDWSYSPLMKAVEQASPKITTAQQWGQWLDANASKLGVTKDEIDFSGIKDFLALKDGKVSKEDINDYLDNNGVVVNDVMKESDEGAVADLIDMFVRDESSGFKNGYTQIFPDGTISIHDDDGIIYERNVPSIIAEELSLDISLEQETKYEDQDLTLPGGENYRELLLTLPEKQRLVSLEEVNAARAKISSQLAPLTQAEYDRLASLGEISEVPVDINKFKSTHFDEPNILAHIRMNDRTDADGNKVLFIEEIQSDWAQAGRKGLFTKGEDYGVPVGPFVTKTKNWVALALKRILALAENEGYKKVAFINGRQSAERYELRKQIQKIDAKKNSAGRYLLDVEFKQKEGERYAKTDTVLAKDEKELAEYVGKELAEKIAKDLNPEIKLNGLSVEQNEDFETFAVYSGDFKVSPNFPSVDDARDARDSLRAGTAKPTPPKGSKMYTGLDLEAGGEGMLAFYDSIVPQVAKEVIKKVGGKNLSEVNIDDIGRQLAIEITPEMSERIAAGQVLFSRKAVPGTSQSLPDTIDVDGVQRPTKNNEGKDIFPTEEGIRNFWRWFGDSTTVDEEGRPMVYYHGTKHPGDIEEFKSHTGMYWATPSPDFASQLAIEILPNENVPSVMPVYVRSLNAFDYKNPKHVRALSEQVSKSGYKAFIPGLSKEANRLIALEKAKDAKKRILTDYATHEGSGRKRGTEEDDNWQTYEELVDDIRALGFDGFHVWESGVDNIASFNKNNLKSALSNTGAYSLEDSRISYSRKPIEPHVKEEVQAAVVKAKEDTRRTGTGAVPLYGKDASPEALYVAQNPQLGATLDLDEQAMYSRKNTPIYSPKARQIIDKNTPRPPDETMGKSIVEMMGFPNARDMLDSFRQAAFFRYARLERQYRENIDFMTQLADTNAVAGVEMADQSRRFTNEAMRKGVIAYENGMTLIKDFYHNGKKIDGLIGVMAMLHTKEYGNLEELAHAFATAVRGERLNSEGKLTPVSPGELAELKKEVAKFINPKTGQPVVEEWFNAWQDYNSYTVKFLRDTGSLDDAGAALWAKQADYVPFYREDKDGNLIHPRVFGGLHTAGQFKAVGKSDKAINVDMVTAITNNIDTAIAMGMKNVAQQRVIRDQIKLGLAHLVKPGEEVGKRASVSFKVSGKRYTAIIEDPLIYESMLPVSEYDLSNILGKILTAPANFFREIIIRDPGYQIANMFRDTLSAYVITGANIVPIVDTVRNIAADISQLEKLGVVGSNYDLNLDRNGVRDFYEKHMRQTQANVYWHKPWLAVWDGLGRLSERSEASTRLAVYNDVLKRTGNMAEAQYQALSVMNYGRRGGNRMMRLATAIIPFLNARMQGLDKLYQASQGRIGAQYDIGPAGSVQRTASQRKNFQRFAARAAIITAMTVLYHSMIEDDDEYLTASPEIRDNYYIIPLLKGDVASGEPGFSMKLPIPFEIGILFKVIPERLLEMAKGEDTPRDFVQSMTRQVKSTLGVNLPQAMLPLYEAYVSNNDSFTGRPVIPTYMENLLPEQQQSFYTNQAIAKAAEFVGMSPMKMEHVASGYFPGVGAYFLQALDSTVREFQGPEMAKPALQWFQYPVVKRFFTTANQPGLQNQFYDLKDQVDGITQTMNKLEEQGRYEELAVFYAKNGHKFDMRSDLNALERQIGKLRDERKIIEQMPIDPEDKRELIEQLNMQINASLLTVPMYRQEAFGKGDRE